MIVVDASVLIAFLSTTDAHHAAARTIMALAGEHTLSASSISLAEALIGPIQFDRGDEAHAMLRDIGIRELPLPQDAPLKLATVRARSGLKLPGCCVVLAAEETGAAIATFDDQLADVAAKRGIELVSSG